MPCWCLLEEASEGVLKILKLLPSYQIIYSLASSIPTTGSRSHIQPLSHSTRSALQEEGYDHHRQHDREGAERRDQEAARHRWGLLRHRGVRRLGLCVCSSRATNQPPSSFSGSSSRCVSCSTSYPASARPPPASRSRAERRSKQPAPAKETRTPRRMSDGRWPMSHYCLLCSFAVSPA